MKIAVLSGKGGTGKTLAAVNLAAVAESAIYIDCDVEEPNGHLFFKPEQVVREAVSIKIPQIDAEKCTGCRRCVEFCKYNALAYVNGKVKVFDAICHSCGGCSLLCPVNAVSERDKEIGSIERGISEDVSVITGILNTGEASGVPIIKSLISRVKNEKVLTVIDCPPGSACIVMESIKDADYCILVAEPTLFGVHNLQMVYELVRLFKKPFGVLLNKCMKGENLAEAFCIEKDLQILGRIPFDVDLSEISSNAEIAVRKNAWYYRIFSALLECVVKEVHHETAAYPKR